MTWDAWEVFDPRDGRPVHHTDSEETARRICRDARDEDRWLDYAPKGKEAGSKGWVPWPGRQT